MKQDVMIERRNNYRWRAIVTGIFSGFSALTSLAVFLPDILPAVPVQVATAVGYTAIPFELSLSALFLHSLFQVLSHDKALKKGVDLDGVPLERDGDERAIRHALRGKLKEIEQKEQQHYAIDVSTQIPGGLMYFTDSVAKYPQQVAALLDKVCVRQALDKKTIKSFIDDVFNGLPPLSKKHKNDLAEDLERANTCSNMTAQELSLKGEYLESRIPQMVKLAVQTMVLGTVKRGDESSSSSSSIEMSSDSRKSEEISSCGSEVAEESSKEKRQEVRIEIGRISQQPQSFGERRLGENGTPAQATVNR
jgi:hypothetical protein